MRFVDIKYKKYSFPLNTPVQNSTQIINHKDVIILKAQDRLGNVYFGEVSPLDGFSKENINDCELRLSELINENQLISEVDKLKTRVMELAEYPSLLFGIEQLILSAEQKYSLNQFEKNGTQKEININGLLGIESRDSILRKVNELVKRGFETIKLKIGRPNFKDDLEIVNLLYDNFGDKLKLRLDNNGNWSYEQAVKNIQDFSKFDIEYIEQPVKGKNELLLLSDNCQLGLAADECIVDYFDAVNIIKSGEIEFLVLKPSIRIGIFNTINLIELANKSGIKIIISSAFETVIARNTLLYLASLTNHNLAHGLSTDLLGADTIPTKINYNVPNFELSDFNYYPPFEANLL